MKTFDVHIWKQISKSTVIRVQAEDKEDAKEAAWDKVWEEKDSVYWNEKSLDTDTSVYEVNDASG